VQELCRTEDPALRTLAAGHTAACHFSEALPAVATGIADAQSEAAARRLALYAERRARVA
jgi:oligopeptide transport system ATP-binding protein